MSCWFIAAIGLLCGIGGIVVGAVVMLLLGGSGWDKGYERGYDQAVADMAAADAFLSRHGGGAR